MIYTLKKICKSFRSAVSLFLIGGSLLFLAGCENQQSIISNIDQREANLIIVLLESKGIEAIKMKYSSGTEMGGETGGQKYQILVDESQTVEAIAFMNQNGFPRKKGTSLLELFAKAGLMSSDKEETIRYQAGLAQQLTNTILMIDGVIDASVQLSFPPQTTLPGEVQKEKITAAVYVKHQGIVDDPNSHLENKIKRLISASISGLDLNDVTVVSDRSRYTDVTLPMAGDKISTQPKQYVKIWSIVMSQQSAARFRFIFFLILSLAIIFAVVMSWFLWKLYPSLRKRGGFKELFKPSPIPPGENEPKKEIPPPTP